MPGDMVAGRYRMLEPLGEGAMSSVWLAEDTELGRRVAVKTLGPAADRARFDREARAAAALSHPHICQLYDYGEVDGHPFMVLEYLGGGTLEETLRTHTPMPDEETQRIASEVASGLAHAHARGLVHRDLKPANVLFDGEGRAKIADFGIARMGDAGTLTEAGTVLGTASYISPEQAAGEPATPASDVYSFGVILFRMLTGRLPFESRNAMELVRMHRDDAPPTVHELRADAPPRLEALASAALSKDPADRPRDGGALLAELGSPAETGTILLTRPPAAEATIATQVVRPASRAATARRRTILLAVLVAAALLLVAGAAVAFFTTGGDQPETTLPPPSLTLPTVSTASTTLDTTTEETEPTTTTTTTPSTTEETTTEEQPTTTAPATTAPATTRTTPTTTATPPTTTATVPTTTETLPTTTETTPTDTTTTTTPGAAG